MQSEHTQLKAYLNERLREPAAEIYFEAMLARANLLSILEETDVLPTVDNPNPYSPISDIQNHDRWWREHPEARFVFCRAIEHRQEALRQLYVGSFLSGKVFGASN